MKKRSFCVDATHNTHNIFNKCATITIYHVEELLLSYLIYYFWFEQRKIYHMYIIKWFFFLSLSSLQWISIIIFIFWESEEKTNEKICDYLRQDNSKSLHTLNAVLHYSKLSVFLEKIIILNKYLWMISHDLILS